MSDASRFSFRLLTRADFPDIVRWHQAPHAVAWFGGEARDPAEAEAKYGDRVDGRTPTTMHAIEIDGVKAGYIEHYLVRSYADYLEAVGDCDAAAIDFIIGEERFTGQGLGPQMIVAYVHGVVVPAHPGILRVVSSPDVANLRSIRTLERAGFRQVKTVDLPSIGTRERICVLDLPGERT